MFQIPLSLLQILNAILILPTAHILENIARISSFNTSEIRGESLDNVNYFKSRFGLIVAGMVYHILVSVNVLIVILIKLSIHIFLLFLVDGHCLGHFNNISVSYSDHFRTTNVGPSIIIGSIISSYSSQIIKIGNCYYSVSIN